MTHKITVCTGCYFIDCCHPVRAEHRLQFCTLEVYYLTKGLEAWEHSLMHHLVGIRLRETEEVRCLLQGEQVLRFHNLLLKIIYLLLQTIVFHHHVSKNIHRAFLVEQRFCLRQNLIKRRALALCFLLHTLRL